MKAFHESSFAWDTPMEVHMLWYMSPAARTWTMHSTICRQQILRCNLL
jgi:hypothetical protein